ncbi:DUF3606 domain-containing protein (plasmid) [Ensifer adhaerens]|uniref:DUF3606 domain-containing protein n=1 Tax=Ensifer adhaerens TaxID=106592 RepID=UPI001CBB2C10|nr:DUF3606 domain-containing protein [Ensifer adhaerens]MBZ7927679.1 DUF3606 domain-containing protein [Ensifer adhaerens]UAX98075.1 DUF3606 domain-containing protein [Ensifer adhaerens]UAY05456.1 DUF3606 domain-containing protein [Ensifer adhaerens]UAY12834.1 DUF3606 domain-containing protein [Ensifer adhaerens]
MLNDLRMRRDGTPFVSTQEIAYIVLAGKVTRGEAIEAIRTVGPARETVLAYLRQRREVAP